MDRFQIHDLCKVISVICNWSEIEECLVNIFPNVLCTSPDMLQILKNFHSEFKSSPSLLELTQKLNQMQDFLKTNDEALVKLQEKCSNLVIMNEDREMLETEQNEENVSNLPDPKLFVSCVDYFDQLSLFVNLTPAFKELFDSEDVFLLCPAQFTNLDLKSAQEVMQFVEIFSDVGKIVKSDDLFNLSQVLPFVAILGNSIRQVECKTYIGMEVKDKLVDFSKKLEERYLEKKILTNAMSFDPRYKMSILKPNVAGLLLMSYKSKLNHEVKSSPREEPPIRQNAVTSSSSSRTLVSFRFSDHVANQTRPSSLSDEQVAEAELLMFFRNKIVDDVCYVKYWQDRLASQKHLSKFALKRLVVPGKMQISSLKKISHSVFSWDRSYENWSSFFLFTLKNYF